MKEGNVLSQKFEQNCKELFNKNKFGETFFSIEEKSKKIIQEVVILRLLKLFQKFHSITLRPNQHQNFFCIFLIQ